ncbi:MAG: hypothetical protein Q7T78_21110 [Rhodoferax sp.]|nr:hypothetical protein [Rhodoferax sp.]
MRGDRAARDVQAAGRGPVHMRAPAFWRHWQERLQPLWGKLGGGGHAQACGFKMGLQRLPELLGGRLDAEKL